jgi:hypothetical protein
MKVISSFAGSFSTTCLSKSTASATVFFFGSFIFFLGTKSSKVFSTSSSSVRSLIAEGSTAIAG